MNRWHKSTHSPNGSDCVEAREHENGADVRDTKHRDAGHLSFDRAEWLAALRVTTKG
ncbi:DUF397 domain-containing protein [Nocardiopsis metallicus]|uniref:DUF397 domain-containing protein n=1 Tax=Nocardiopsis metallicus TaxID=179819 RepID=A0A840WMX8_9ACTN|nr:DUF397 domain-containing protein [Nocardiopsis metallicus]MBB5493125.1 hypothetical protein [Nocardiopsis metallicus]